MMVRITADKKEAAVTQKAVAQQEQDANEQAAKVHLLWTAHDWRLCASASVAMPMLIT